MATDPTPSTDPVTVPSPQTSTDVAAATVPPSVGAVPPAVASTPSGKPRRGNVPRWLVVIGGIVVLLILLVVVVILFLPTIASTSAVRGMVLSSVNKNLNGRVEISDWSLGWTSGLKVTGVAVYDASNAQIAQLPELSTELTLLDVIRGNFALGNVLIQGLDANVITYPDGTTNLSKLSKSSSSTATSTETSPSSTSSSSTTLPNFSANITFKDCRATYIDKSAEKTSPNLPPAQADQTIQVTALNGTIAIPSINQPYEQHLVIGEKCTNLSPGTIKIDGQITIAKDNKLDLAEMAGEEKVVMADALSIDGFTVGDFNLAEKISDGVATAEPSAKTATCNGGALNLSNVAFNFGGAVMTIDIPAGSQILSNIQLNGLLAAELAPYSPIFAGATDASGVLNLTCNGCKALPMGALLKSTAPANTGVADFVYSITDLKIISSLFSQFTQLGGINAAFSVDNAKEHIERGVVTTDMTLAIGGKSGSIGFNGGLGLANEDFENFTVSVGAGFLPNILGSHQIAVPLTGTVSGPQIDLPGAVQKNLLGGAGGAISPQGLGNLFGLGGKMKK